GEPTVFRFRARRVRRWLGELDIENDEAWGDNLRQAILERLRREGCAVDEHAVAVRLISDETGVNGAVLVDGTDCEVHQADTTILAGDGPNFLWPDPEAAGPPTGIAMALRAKLPMGNLGEVAWQDERPTRFLDAIHADSRGQCGVPGVAACGQARASALHAVPALAHLEDVVRGLEAGAFQGPPAGDADPELVPIVDDPMPPGFTQVKLQRLRATLAKMGSKGTSTDALERLHAELLSLRGECADYARARAATDVHVLHQAADVALGHVASRLGQRPVDA
ncbi:MAG: hypothetical protein R3185_04665, partial [Candidatus Thermoplasmatota archaeon]|nr:hypothetical protein [Candidatus Thermoplasmatota archaeon]